MAKSVSIAALVLALVALSLLAPNPVASSGEDRTTTGPPTRSSSARIRCDIAEGVTPSLWAASSKLPASRIATRAER